MKEILKKITAVISLVALIGIGSYAFGVRAADTTTPNKSATPSMQSGNITTPSQSGMVAQPSTGSMTPSGSQTNVIVPQQQPYGGYAAIPAVGSAVAPGESLGSLIVLNGLFGNTGTTTTTVTNNDPVTTTTTNGLLSTNGVSNSAQDLAGLIAVNNLTSPMAWGGGLGGAYASPYYGGYAATPAYGVAGGYAGDTLGGLIVLNGLFGNTGTTTTTTSETAAVDPTVTTTTNGAFNGMSTSAQDLAGLIAVNNLLSPYAYGAGFGGAYASPYYGGYAATPAYGVAGGYAGDTLGGLIVLNGLFGNTGTTTTTVTNDDPVTTTTNGTFSGMSDSARGLAGLIAVNNTTSPLF